MISIMIKIEEVMGRVEISMTSPKSPNATANETIHAGLMCQGIREVLTAITKARGKGSHLLVQSSVGCSKCGKIHDKRKDTIVYTCDCGQSFGA